MHFNDGIYLSEFYSHRMGFSLNLENIIPEFAYIAGMFSIMGASMLYSQK